ncbi:MAG: sulfatase-like hydrolase/transferase, partial [Pirellulales bacterium]|nr:sulfatase-like hydrolase/transferase [Pirellulales bacterium]
GRSLVPLLKDAKAEWPDRYLFFHKGRWGKKGSVEEGGTRVPFFVRWPGKFKAGTDVDRIARHFDILPTFAEIVGAEPKEKDKLHGRSLVPLLKDAKAEWPDRYLFFHKGRWGKKGVAGRFGGTKGAEGSKMVNFAVRSQRFRLVGPNQLYDIPADPGQKNNVIDKHPEEAKKMLAAYEKWWEGALPNMVNEDAKLTGPNTFHKIFYEQIGKPTVEPKKRNKRKKD